MEPIEMLRAVGPEARTFNADEWNELLRFSITSLNQWFGYSVETEALEHGCVGEGAAGGFCLEILNACSSNNDVFRWKGVLGASIIDGKIRVRLFAFLYSGSHRLVTKDGKEFGEFVLEIGPSGHAGWKLFGWFEDTYGEFSQY